ncbi:hypothetical protein CEP51_010889 [Fusarium floridanum]|uniref:Uncharacterized protein n=1 Tax=Fusarium floridanum TaxID=1325733 RepID=A0A428RCZ2_9HYPO|nr:hypothetical protein CEP51_010889 [Fusarium floridanum]
MATGLFELCHAEVYSDLPFQHGPGCDVSLPQHSAGRQLEVYLQKNRRSQRSGRRQKNGLLVVGDIDTAGCLGKDKKKKGKGKGTQMVTFGASGEAIVFFFLKEA